MDNLPRRAIAFVLLEAVLFLTVGNLSLPSDLQAWGWVVGAIIAALYFGFEFGKWCGEGPHHPKRDIRVNDVTRYVAMGSFRADFGPSIGDVRLSRKLKSIESIREEARDRRVVVWGRPDGLPVYQPIPAEYWNTAQLEAIRMWLDDHPVDQGVETRTCRLTSFGPDIDRYSDLWLNKRQVIKTWRGGWRRRIGTWISDKRHAKNA